MPNYSQGLIEKQYRISILKELFRKSIHLCSAFTPFFLLHFYIPTIAVLIIALSVYSVSELLRLEGVELPVLAKVTAVAARKRDENKFVLGPVTLVLGIIITALLWRPEAARIGIFALAFGDGLASLFGKLFGRLHIPFSNGKTVAGSLTCFTAVYISSFCVCHNAGTALILALCAMLTEVIPMNDFDNLIIPMVIGGIAQHLMENPLF